MPTGSTPSPDLAHHEFVISRAFDAPRSLVFQAFAESGRLAQWWGPKGFDIEVSRHEFKPGGIFHYRMVGSDGHDMWGRFTYREIVEPERIDWVNAFSDPAGNVVRAPFGLAIPLEILNSVTLAEQDGKTTVTLRAIPLDPTAEERATFEGMFDSMDEGYGGTWDKLAEHLAKEQAAA
jgi:uncharacterized protein YndB with AHSA1/START domain